MRTRSDILAAARLEFAERGYALTTAKSVAERAKIATGAFYHYFPNKDVVLRELTSERMQVFEEQLSASKLDSELIAKDPDSALEELRRRIRKDIRTYIENHRNDRGLHAVMTERRLCDPELDAIMARAESAGVERMAKSLTRRGFDGDALATAFLIFALVDGAVHTHVLSHAMVSDTRFIQGLVEAVMRMGMPAAQWQRISQSK